MPSISYRNVILDVLQGRTSSVEGVSPERLDWSGPASLLKIYEATRGEERKAFVQAVGWLIRTHDAPLPVIAQLVDMASALGIDVYQEVSELSRQPVAAQEPLKGAIGNYLTFRDLNLQSASAEGAML